MLTIYSLTLFLLLGVLSFVEGSLKFSRTDEFPNMVHFRSADYGYIPYGKVLKGNIVTTANDTNHNNCVFKKDKHIQNGFLIVNNTECSVITKAYNAQLNKAAMVIVVADTEDIDSIHLLNSGLSDKIHIPVVMIGQKDGEKAMNIASGILGNFFSAECYFPRTVAVNSTITRVDYWFDPMDTSNYIFFYQFSNLHKELGYRVNFNVHLALGFNQQTGDAQTKKQDCVSDGRYCAINTREGGVANGKDIVLTGLAILCLSRQDKSYLLTRTLISFDLMCLIPQLGMIEAPYECLGKIASSMGYNRTNFEKDCFDTTFIEGNKENENALLKQELGEYNQEVVQIWPELYVNSRAIRGNTQSLDNVESAVCGGYSDPVPSACYEYFEEHLDDSFSAGTIIMIIMLSAGFMFAVLFGIFRFYYHRKFKQQIDSEVNQVISKYISFQDEQPSD